MACRQGCRTKNHRTWGECARAANIQLDVGEHVARNRDWDSDIEAYKSARQQGIQPDSTKREDVLVAKAFSEHTGVAYDGGDKGGTLMRSEGVA